MTESILLVGCGAISEEFYLPALKNIKPAPTKIALLDRNPDQAQKAAAFLPQATIIDETESQQALWDLVILATPPQVHSAGIQMYQPKAKAVLVEKPLWDINTTTDFDLLPHVHVNQTRRLFPISQKVRDLIQAGTLGALQKMTYYEGQRFGWASSSAFYTQHGRPGVLQDRGSHVIDLLLWQAGLAAANVDTVTFPTPGLPESHIVFTLNNDRNIDIEVALSWEHKMANRFVYSFERGTLSGGIYDWRECEMVRDGKQSLVKAAYEPAAYSGFGAIAVDRCLQAIRSGTPTELTAHSVQPSIEIIDKIYHQLRDAPQGTEVKA